jgi:Tfp pilus assembly protein FimV
VVLSLIISSFTLLLTGPVTHAFVAGAEVRHVPHRTYVVRPGDTLWAIAERTGPAGADPRAVVGAMEQANRVSAGSLEPGQVLVIPTTV